MADTGSTSLLLSQPIVLDNGTNSIKAGFAGSSVPKTILSTKTGRVKHSRVMPGGDLEGSNNNALFVGPKLNQHRGAFVLSHPMEHGEVKNWDDMERLWEFVYSKANLNAKQEEHPVLLTEAPLNNRKNRQQTAELFFETFNVPALHFAPPSILSLYASGRTTGVVLDVGEGTCHAIPVYEGLAVHHSTVRTNVAGRMVTQHLQQQLRSAGVYFTTTAEMDLVQDIKEQVCYMTNNNTSTDALSQTTTKSDYKLPDGSTIALGPERYQAPNVLMDPSLMGSEELGCADLLVNSILKSDLELRPKLFSQIVLAGGSTLLPGFGNCLLQSIQRSAPRHTKIRISAPPDRHLSAYCGGSILASLATFKTMYTTKQQFEESGPNVLFADE